MGAAVERVHGRVYEGPGGVEDEEGDGDCEVDGEAPLFRCCHHCLRLHHARHEKGLKLLQCLRRPPPCQEKLTTRYQLEKSVEIACNCQRLQCRRPTLM